MTWTAPNTVASGDIYTSANYNTYTRDNLRWLNESAYKPLARYYHSVALGVLDSTPTFQPYNTESYDAAGLHDPAVNTRVVQASATLGGKYLIGAIIAWSTNNVGLRRIELLVTGATITAQSILPAGNTGLAPFTQELWGVVSLGVTDYAEVRLYQTAGATVSSIFQANYTPVCYVVGLSN